MDKPRLSTSIRKLILLETDGAGNVTPVVLFETPRKKEKKTTRLLRPLEKAVRRAANAEATFAKSYVARHHRSNEKKKNGWARDLNVNLMKATRRGFKKSPLGRLLP